VSEVVSPAQAAEQAGLIYTSDDTPGISRRRSGKGFSYIDPDGKVVTDAKTIARIKSLVIPPAYRDVWICPSPRGHLQFTGIDEKGRKQYRYHPDWSAARDSEKFERMAIFAQALPRIRAQIDRDLRRPIIDRQRVLALAVALLEKTLLRVGNRQYAQENGSFGLTTLKSRHALVTGSQIRLKFKGKSAVVHDVSIRDRRLANLMRKLQELPGQELFTYQTRDGGHGVISSSDVNDYLKEISGESLTAKDFRTWAGTLLAFEMLSQCPECESPTARKREVGRVVKSVAATLGNTAAVCRKSYIHFRILEQALERLPLECLHQDAEAALICFLESMGRKDP
jgi:DNA topoisomerase-1